MQSLTKEAEQKLITAIERAAELVNSGMTPNDAIVKSASAANVPAGHINLMVHAYNTGRTTKQREQGEDTLEKAADFQLADAQVVMDALYPKTVKTSAEIVRQQIVSTDYAVSPAGMLARRRAVQEKAAAAQVALPEKTYQPYPRDEQAAAERAYSEKRAAQLAKEEIRRQANAAYSKAASAMDQLAEFFKRPGHMSFADATKQVELRLGDEGVSVLHKVAEVYPHFKKQAATTAHHFGDNPVYGLVQNVLSAVTEYVSASAKIEKVAEFGKKKAPEFITGSIMYNPVAEPLELMSPTVKASFAAAAGAAAASAAAAKKKQMFDDTVKGIGDAFKAIPVPAKGVAKILGNYGGKAKEKALHAGAYKALTDPEHEMKLKNIRAHATLQDLMLNDSVIGGYDPHEVAMAFNDVAEAAPNVVNSSALLQSVLRKRLEAGQLADFDVKQLMDMDKTKADRDNVMLESRKLEQDLI